jgi:iron(III) transport system substrate-binding protein
MYNEAAHPAGAPVRNLWELTESAWRGGVVLVDPLIRGDYLDLLTEMSLRSEAMAEAYRQHTGSELLLDVGVPNAGEQWIRRLFANSPVLVEDTDQVNERVGATGQTAAPVGFTSYSDRRDNAEEGWALQVAADVAPAPGIAFPALLGLTKEPPHPTAARLLVAFLMGDGTPSGGAGWAPFAAPGEYPTRRSTAAHPDALSFDQLGAWTVDASATAAARGRVAALVLELR